MASKKRTLVKLDDTVFEMGGGDKGLESKKLDTDDLFEVSLLEQGLEKLLENDINKLANEVYSDIKDDFKTNLTTNTLKIVGFDNRYNRWEVDHCNGRSSDLTEYMSHKVKLMFHEEYDKMLQPEIAKMLIPLKEQVLKEFKECFTNELRRNMRQSAQEAAKEFLHDAMKNQVEKFQDKVLARAQLSLFGRTSEPTDSEQ